MQPSHAALQDYLGFISNPQGEGVWSLRIELSENQVAKLGSFLNVTQHMSRGRFGSPYPRHYSLKSYRPLYGYEDGPPIFVPRLFAYLRAAMAQKDKLGLPNLTVQQDELRGTRAGILKQRRTYRFFDDILTPPTRLSPAKRQRLRKALEIYQQYFVSCRMIPVPEEIAKIDVVCSNPVTYFQIHEDSSALRISSPSESVLHQVSEILATVIQDDVDAELTKVFSPENALMAMYLPILRLIPFGLMLRDKTSAVNVSQALDEAREERFVHAIRAIGIAAEELLVGIYETYLREKAPEAPLGNIINELNERVQEAVQGAKASRESSLGAAKKQIGRAIETEKNAQNNPSIILLAEQLQQNVIPILESLKQSLDENTALSLKAQKIQLFPPNVKRCLSELVNLRNRVSHRVEKVVSVASVGYVDTAIALRDFIVVAKWWESERKQLNYKATPKIMIQETVKRSRSQDAGTPNQP
jgi:hypothetical protein